MKIEATCGTCGRTFLLSQIGYDSDAPGRCPFCGARFARHYRGTLVETVEATERAASEFLVALERLLSMETGFHLDAEKLLQDLKKDIEEHHPLSA
jgi:DNA-directed RNA polymerase subunit RPC12/RpoP